MQTPVAGACIRNSSFAELYCANAVEVGYRKHESAFRKAIHMSVKSPTWTLNLFRFSWDLVGTSLVLVDGSRRHREPPTHLCAWNNARPLCDDGSPPQEHKIRNRLNPKLSGERRALLRVDLED